MSLTQVTVNDRYNSWYFTTSRGSFECPSIPFKCNPPNACAIYPDTGRQYCCDAGEDGVCWTGSTECKTDGSTIQCNGWCCLADSREQCTQTKNQVNICWSRVQSSIQNISVVELSSVASSLATARPSATYLTFSPSAWAKTSPASSTVVGASTSTGGTTFTSSADAAAQQTGGSGSAGSDSSSDSSSNSQGSTLGTGAIAGIVVGVVALAVIAAVGYFLWRRVKRRDEAAAADAAAPKELEGSGSTPQTMYQEVHGFATAKHEAPGSPPASELGTPFGMASELGTPYTAAVPTELPTHNHMAVELPAESYPRATEKTNMTPEQMYHGYK